MTILLLLCCRFAFSFDFYLTIIETLLARDRASSSQAPSMLLTLVNISR